MSISKPFYILFIVMAIILSKTMIVRYVGDDLFLLTFLFSLLAYYILLLKKINIRRLSVYIVLIALIFLIGLLNDSNLVRVGGVILTLSSCFLFVEIIPKNVFVQYYKKIIFWLCVGSLISWVIVNFVGYQAFPTVEIMDDTYKIAGINFYETIELQYSRYNLFGYSFVRNNSIFWEGGAFQFFVNIALYFQIYDNTFNLKKPRTIILIASVLTSLSLVGYIILSMNFLYFLIKSPNLSKNRKTVLFVISVISMFSIFYNTSLTNKGIDYMSLIMGAEAETSNVSAARRYFDIHTDLAIFMENPIVGYGLGRNDKWTSKFSTLYFSADDLSSSNGLSNILSSVGLIVFIFYMYILFVNKFGEDRYSTIFILINLLFQNIGFMAMTLIFILYGRKNKY